MISNILLIDPNLRFIDKIGPSNSFNVKSIIIDYKEQLKDIKYEVDDIFYIKDINEVVQSYSITIDYEIIEKYKSTQLKVEHFLNRVSDDTNLIQFIYFSALNYFINYFINNKIDLILCDGLELGGVFDTVIFDIALNNSIPIYLIEPILVNGRGDELSAIFHYNSKKYMDLGKISSLEICNIEKFMFSSISHQDDFSCFNSSRRLKEIIISSLEYLGGYILKAIILKFLGKFKSEFHTFEQSFFKLLSEFINSLILKKYYAQKTVPFDVKTNYVFYALHMEPEGGTMVRTSLSNQLFIIKMISDLLPKDWVLYVKEHPHQYNLNNNTMYYFLFSLSRFRTKLFYDSIVKLKNVKLINMDIPSRDIVKEAKAVATINGTITIESLKNNVPVLMFDNHTLPFVEAKGVYPIVSASSLSEAFNQIKNQSFILDNDLDVITKKYLFVFNSINCSDLIEKLIKGDI